MAFYDSEKNRLVGIDLKTGQGWAVLIPKPVRLEWSPDGSQLLVSMSYPTEDHNVFEYLLFEKDGKLIQQFIQERYLDWQPQGAELRTQGEQKIIRSPNGAEAWLEGTFQDKTLHFRASGTDEWKTALLDIRPMEWGTEVYGWIPGTSSILLTHGSGSVHNNAAFGQELYMFNTQTRELRSLGLHGHFNPQSAAMRGPDLAVIQLHWGIAVDTLAILNGKTGDVSYPLNNAMGEIQSYSLWQLAWQPGKDGDDGLFAMMVRVSPDHPAPSLFPKPGIYLYNRTTGQSQVVRETPENVVGGNFYWTADGQYLLYTVGSSDSDQKIPASLYARQISTGKEWMLIDRLISPDVFLSYISWNLIAVHLEKTGE